MQRRYEKQNDSFQAETEDEKQNNYRQTETEGNGVKDHDSVKNHDFLQDGRAGEVSLSPSPSLGGRHQKKSFFSKVNTLLHASWRPVPVFPGGSDLLNTSRISNLLGPEGPKTVFIGTVGNIVPMADGIARQV